MPGGRRVCPHCEQARPWRRGARLAARLLGASAALVTLMACYGMIARPHGPNDGVDRDGDGAGSLDCDDARPDVYPGAGDLDGDGVDQNCDGVDGWLDPEAPTPQARIAAQPADPDAIATDPPPPPTPPAVIATDPASPSATPPAPTPPAPTPPAPPAPPPPRPKAVATDPASAP